jgi:hypothetical protein
MNLLDLFEISDKILWDLTPYDYFNPNFNNLDDAIEREKELNGYYFIFYQIFNDNVKLMIAALQDFAINIEPLDFAIPINYIDENKEDAINGKIKICDHCYSINDNVKLYIQKFI